MKENYNWMNLSNAESYTVIYHLTITTHADNCKHVNKNDFVLIFIEKYLQSSIPQTIRIMFNAMEIDNPMTKLVELCTSWFVSKWSALSTKTSVTLY